jgi:hypothetical protein
MALIGPLILIILASLYFLMPKKTIKEDRSHLLWPSSKEKPRENSSQKKETALLNANKPDNEGEINQKEEGDKKDNPLAWDKSFEELLDVSGVENQIRNFDELLKRQLDLDLEGEEGVAWKKNMAKNFKSKFILEEIKKEFQNVSPGELKEMLSSFEDPLMRKVSKLEELATMSDSREQFEEFSKDFDNLPPDPEREKLIKDIDKHSGSTENTVNMMMELMKGSQMGQNSDLPADEQIEEKEIAEAMEEIRPQIKDMMANSMHKNQQFAYKDLPNEDLKNLSKKVQEPQVKKYQDLISRGITKAFREMGENFGRDMTK